MASGMVVDENTAPARNGEEMIDGEPPTKQPKIRSYQRLVYNPPSDKDSALNLRLLCQPQRIISFAVCADCGVKAPARTLSKEATDAMIIELQLCPSCSFTNKRIANAIYFNVTAKDEYDDQMSKMNEGKAGGKC
jgi:hypothetical protein